VAANEPQHAPLLATGCRLGMAAARLSGGDGLTLCGEAHCLRAQRVQRRAHQLQAVVTLKGTGTPKLEHPCLVHWQVCCVLGLNSLLCTSPSEHFDVLEITVDIVYAGTSHVYCQLQQTAQKTMKSNPESYNRPANAAVQQQNSSWLYFNLQLCNMVLWKGWWQTIAVINS